MTTGRIAASAFVVLALASLPATAQNWPSNTQGPGQFPPANGSAPAAAPAPGQFAPARGPGQFPSASTSAPGQFPPANSPTTLPAQPGAVPPPSQWGKTAPAGQHPAWGGGGAQRQAAAPPCADEFMPLRNDAQTKGMAIKAAVDKKAERAEICKAFKTFVAAEAKVVKFVQQNGARCQIPDDAVKVMKANHSKSVTMSNRVCNAAGPSAPPPPSLSDALGTSRIPDSSTIKTGKGGTFDTLGGSAIAR